MQPQLTEPQLSGTRDRASSLVAAALLFLAASAALLLPALQPGSILAPVDLLYETPVYAPLRPDSYDEPANPHLFDQAYQFVPWRKFAWERWRDGDAPLWNPLSATGTPFAATMQAAVFYPVNLLTLPLPFAATFVASALLRLWVAGFCAYLLMRRYGASSAAGLLTGVSFMLSGFVVAWLGHPHTNVAVWLPALILAVEGLIASGSRRESMRWWAVLALVTGMQFLGGHIETSRDVLFAGGLYALVRVVQMSGSGLRRVFERLALAGSAVVAGAWIAAIQLAPFIEWLPLSAEYRQRSGFDFALWSFDPRSLLALPLAVMPNLYGNPAWDGQYWSFNPWGSFNESVLYAGVVPLALAIATLMSVRSASIVRAWWIAGAVSLGLALRLPVLDWINQLPGMSLAHPGRLRLVAIFAVAVLAGFGLDALSTRVGARRWFQRALAVAVALPVSTLLLFNVVLPLFQNWETRAVARGIEHFSGSSSPPRSALVCQERIEACGRELAQAFALSNWEMYLVFPVGLAALLFVTLASRRPAWMSRIAPAFIVLTGIELVLTGWGFNPAVDADVIQARPPGMEQAVGIAGDGRVVVLQQDSLPDSHMLYGVADVRGLDFKTSWYETYLDASGARIPWLANGVLLDDVGPLIATLDVGAVVTSNIHIVDGLTADGTMRVAATDGELTVLEPVPVMPGAVMRYSVKLTASDEAAADLIAESPELVLANAILPDTLASRELRGQLSGADPAASVEAVRSEPERRSWRVSTASAGLLVVSDAYYPGWTATVDGEPVEIHRTNIAFRGVLVAPGDHVVEMRYRPAPVRYGALVSLLSVIAVIGVLVLSFTRGRDQAPSPSSSRVWK